MTKKELSTALYYLMDIYCRDREVCGISYEQALEETLEDLNISWKEWKHIEDENE